MREGITPSSASTYQSDVFLAPSNISHSHNHNLWMEHPAQSSSSALLPGPCLIFSWCWDFIVWEFFFFIVFFFFFFFFSQFWRGKAKNRIGRGGKGGFFLKHLVHLSPQSWSDVVGQRWRLLPAVSAPSCRIHTVEAFKYVKPASENKYSCVIELASWRAIISLVFYLFYQLEVKYNLGIKPSWL